MFLFGKVVMDDGSAIPEPVPVELICNGHIRMRVFSHSKGDFSLELGSRQTGAMFDASMSGSGGGIFNSRSSSPWDGGFGGGDYNAALGRVDLTGCELRASLPGFQSSSISLGFRRVFDRPDVGAIVLRRLGKVDGTTVSFNSLAAPEKAKKSYEKALNELSKKNPDRLKAAKELENAVKEYPAYATAWNLLGKARLAMQDKAGAKQAFEKSVSADSKYIDPYLSLAALEMDRGNWAEILKLTTQVQQLNPYVTHSHFLAAVANFQLGQLILAEKSLHEVENSSDAQRYPMTHYLRGAILANRGDFVSAASEFRRFLQTKPDSTLSADVNKALAEWEQRGYIKREISQVKE
jgi:Tfp pilus assembly protein PilF